MSYDIWLTIDTGGTEPAHIGHGWNYTSNCAPMWRAAGADLAEFDGKTAGECLPQLHTAIDGLKASPAVYRAMNPDNGWGSYDILVTALDVLALQFAAHPKATVRVSR